MKKFLAIVLSAVLFGGVAGGTMLGINTLSGGRMITAAAGVTGQENKTLQGETSVTGQETAAETEAAATTTKKNRLFSFSKQLRNLSHLFCIFINWSMEANIMNSDF